MSIHLLLSYSSNQRTTRCSKELYLIHLRCSLAHLSAAYLTLRLPRPTHTDIVWPAVFFTDIYPLSSFKKQIFFIYITHLRFWAPFNDMSISGNVKLILSHGNNAVAEQPLLPEMKHILASSLQLSPFPTISYQARVTLFQHLPGLEHLHW